MGKKDRERLQRSFEKTLLDTPVPNANKKVIFYPTKKGLKSKAVRILKPKKYVSSEPEMPVPPPRFKKLQRLHNRSREEMLKRSESSKKVRKLKEQIESIYEKERKLGEIVKQKSWALKNYAKSFELTIVEREDPAKQLNYTRKYVFRTLEEILKKEKGLKATRALNITLKKKQTIEEGETFYEFKNVYFKSKAFTITNIYQIQDAVDQRSEDILNEVAVWISEGSGWTIEKILSDYVNIATYQPLRGSSYIPFPKELRNPRKGLINLKVFPLVSCQAFKPPKDTS